MDKDQIKLFVEENISKNESHDELTRREISRFISALQSQETNLGRTPTPDEIMASWQHWRKDHVDNPSAYNVFLQANVPAIQQAALNHVNKIQPKMDDILSAEAIIFAKAYSNKLSHLAKLPAPEHIELSWRSWKSGQRW